MNRNQLGEYIYILRKNAKLTQEQFGELLGINGKSVSKWERGITNPSISTLIKISKIFNVSIDELFTLNSPFE